MVPVAYFLDNTLTTGNHTNKLARPYSYHPLPPELTFILFILKAPVRSRKRPDGHESKQKNQNKLYVSWGYAGLSF